MLLKLKFLEGWSLENRRQKQLKKYRFLFNVYFFEGLAAGKPVAKNLDHNISFFFFKPLFLEGVSRENRQQQMERLELL